LKIIDEKGRLFGKINIIDFTVIFLACCLIPMFYFGYKILKKPSGIPEIKKEYTDITVHCQFVKVPSAILPQISEGDKELDETGKIIGEITKTGEVTPYVENFDIGAGNYVDRRNPDFKNLKTKIKLHVEIKNNALFYKDKKIYQNSEIEFKTVKYVLTGVIKTNDIYGEGKKEIELPIVMKELNDDIIKLIEKGDKSIDENGKVTAEIIELGNIYSDSYKINMGNNNFIVIKDNLKKQLNARLRLLGTITKNQELFFQGKQLTQDSTLEFKTEKYTVPIKITNAYDMPTHWIEIKVKFSSVIHALNKFIKEGDIDCNNYGVVLGKLNKIIDISPSELIALSSEEPKFIQAKHPYLSDITASLDVLCTNRNEVFYYKDSAIRIGDTISFTTNTYNLTGTIIEFKVK